MATYMTQWVVLAANTAGWGVTAHSPASVLLKALCRADWTASALVTVRRGLVRVVGHIGRRGKVHLVCDVTGTPADPAAWLYEKLQRNFRSMLIASYPATTTMGKPCLGSLLQTVLRMASFELELRLTPTVHEVMPNAFLLIIANTLISVKVTPQALVVSNEHDRLYNLPVHYTPYNSVLVDVGELCAWLFQQITCIAKNSLPPLRREPPWAPRLPSPQP